MAFEKKVPQWYASGAEPPAELKQSGFTHGYKPPADFFNWFWSGVSEALTELQGMEPGDIGAEKALYLGGEPVASIADDTFEKWTNIGTGYAFYGATGLLNGQPSQYGYLLNIATASNVAQLWLTLPHGTMYYRGGNNSGLATSWTKVLNSAQVSEILLDSLGGVLSPEKGGTGKTTLEAGFTNLLRRSSVGSNNLVNADTLTTPGVHQVYFEDATYNPADYNFPYAYGVLVVDSTVSCVGQLFYAVSANKLWYRTRATTSSAWGSWCRVYDTNNKPTLDELGAAASATHNMQTYTLLSQLGLDDSATLSEVANALPAGAMLRIYVLTSSTQNLSADGTNGWFEAYRPNANHVRMTFTTTAKKSYVAYVLNKGTENETVGEWTKLLTEDDIILTTTDPGAGTAVDYEDGTVIHVYE